jgi:L-2-hydroxycarboxylate dehydrogenase (NAD+)
MQVSISTLRDTTIQAIKTFGYSSEEANMIANVLLYSELRGKDQGLIKLINPGIPKHPSQSQIEVSQRNAVTTHVNGGLHHPMIVMHKAVESCVEQALQAGVSITSVTHTTSSSGCIGYFAERLAERNLIGLVLASSTTAMVTVPGSSKKLFGTNPIAYAFPTNGDPIVADFATSAISLFGVRQADLLGEDLPDGVAVDADGNPTCDPKSALAGSLLTFGGHKGALLSLLVELLAGCFGGAGFPGGDDKAVNSGHLLIAIKPDSYMGMKEYYQRLESFTNTLSSAANNTASAFIPGYRGLQKEKSITDSGVIEIDDSVWKKIEAIANP